MTLMKKLRALLFTIALLPGTAFAQYGGYQQPGVSVHGTAGTGGSDVVIQPRQFKGWVTIINTSASNTLYISFNNPATTSDFPIAPGAALTMPFAPTNTLYGVGSAASTTFAVTGE